MDVSLHPHHAYTIYIDDTVIYAATWQEHVHLGHDLRKAGLTVNPQKCHLGLTKAQYLG